MIYHRRAAAPAPVSREGWTQGLEDGCTADGCGTQQTEWLHPQLGRRCAEHAPDFRDETEENECPA